MQAELEQINAAGLNVVGISYDSIEILKEFTEEKTITFPLLSDPDSQTIAAYAIRNQETKGQTFGDINLDGVPYPGTYIINTDGVVRAKLFLEGYRARHSVEELIEAAAVLEE